MSEDKQERIAWCTDERLHTSTDGHRIIERTYHGDLLKDTPTPRYVGIGVLVLNVQGPQGVMQQPHEFEFGIKADGIADAFARFVATYREAGKKEADRVQREMNAAQNRIAVPTAGQSGKILRAS